MQHNIANAPEETIADFTVAHLAILKECQEKAIAIVRKDNPKMSELNAALNILIKIEKQQYNITHRRPPTSKSSKTRHEPTSIIAFTPSISLRVITIKVVFIRFHRWAGVQPFSQRGSI